jgi:hypothetical protein
MACPFFRYSNLRSLAAQPVGGGIGVGRENHAKAKNVRMEKRGRSWKKEKKMQIERHVL